MLLHSVNLFGSYVNKALRGSEALRMYGQLCHLIARYMCCVSPNIFSICHGAMTFSACLKTTEFND